MTKTDTTFETVTSADGTPIALERRGDGPPVILIGGAFNDRTTVAGLAAALAPAFTAVAYDRRGRGDSGDGGEYAVEREIEDVAALIEHVGGSARVFGHSSGAVLALEAAARGVAVDRLAVYEPSYAVPGTRPLPAGDVPDRLRALVRADRREDAVTLFMTEQVGVPSEMVAGMRGDEAMWGWFVGLAHTLPYDVALCGPGMAAPAGRLGAIGVPTLAIGGELSPPWLPAAARMVAECVSSARYVTLAGQDHGVLNQAEALTPLLTDFLA